MKIEYDGMTVPWVARWTGEIEGLDITDQWIKPYRLGGREFNVVWEKNKIGSGEPLFSKVHTRRALKSQFHHKCQVCGEDARIHDDYCLYAIMARDPDTDLFVALNPGDTVYGAEMPVCESCVRVSMKQCPHLRQADRVWIEGYFNGVVGALVSMDVTGPAYFTTMENFDNLPEQIIVRQFVVQIVVDAVISDIDIYLSANPGRAEPSVVEDKEAGTD